MPRGAVIPNCGSLRPKFEINIYFGLISVPELGINALGTELMSADLNPRRYVLLQEFSIVFAGFDASKLPKILKVVDKGCNHVSFCVQWMGN